MIKYKVFYSGFAYVEANDKDNAAELFDNDSYIYCEQQIDTVTEIDDFAVMI